MLLARVMQPLLTIFCRVSTQKALGYELVHPQLASEIAEPYRYLESLANPDIYLLTDFGIMISVGTSTAISTITNPTPFKERVA